MFFEYKIEYEQVDTGARHNVQRMGRNISHDAVHKKSFPDTLLKLSRKYILTKKYDIAYPETTAAG
ncbi:MAG TPA: hypothetical protein VJZ16_02920 [Syntrophales bacterium]|nr:hypothetical protein [Syntrophales bacterium]